MLAFEPTAFAIEKLRRNVQLNIGLADRITATQTMLADTEDYRLPEYVYCSWPLVAATGYDSTLAVFGPAETGPETSSFLGIAPP